MFHDKPHGSGEATNQERRAIAQPDTRILGRVVSCDGSRATIMAEIEDSDLIEQWTVGRMISINLGPIRTVGFVYAIRSIEPTWVVAGTNTIEVKLELVGEIRDTISGPIFDRGVTVYPHLGAIAHRIRQRDLKAVYDLGGRLSVTVGHLTQDTEISANVAIDSALNRHFAVVGTTGVGKSTAVSLLVRKAIEARPNLRVLILDPHNEFATAFPNDAVRIDLNGLDLPFWLFQLEELVEVLYRGRETVAEEIDILRDLIAQAKILYRGGQTNGLMRRSGDANAVTADTPIPYRIADLIQMIDDRMGTLDAKEIRPALRSLRSRIDGVINDPRYRFMFASRLIEDNIHQAIGRIFRVPHEGRRIACFSMAGMPSEVVNALCSVLARLAFDLTIGSEGRFKLLVLCEEAHRYVPSDPRLGFAPTRHALSRIAKEGRKYGCYLGVVTQRPGELDVTILSQCSTVFAMRLANEVDQDIIRSAIADSSVSTLSFLSSMGQREAIVFGEGVATTMRLKFERLPASMLPGGHEDAVVADQADDDVDLGSIVDRWRSNGRNPGLEGRDGPQPQAGDTQRPSTATLAAAERTVDHGSSLLTQRYPAPSASSDDDHRRLVRRRVSDTPFGRF